MKRILSDFYKSRLPDLLRYVFISAVCVTAFALTGIYTRDNTRVPAIIISAFLCGTTLYAAFEAFVLSRLRFEKELKALSASEANEILNGYHKATKLGKRRFYKKKWLMLWTRRRIEIFRYNDITEAKLKLGFRAQPNKIYLTLKDGKRLAMPVEANENGTMLLAVIKGFCENAVVTVGAPFDGKEKT